MTNHKGGGESRVIIRALCKMGDNQLINYLKLLILILMSYKAQLVVSLQHRDLMGPGSNPVTKIYRKDTVPIIFFIYIGRS